RARPLVRAEAAAARRADGRRRREGPGGVPGAARRPRQAQRPGGRARDPQRRGGAPAGRARGLPRPQRARLGPARRGARARVGERLRVRRPRPRDGGRRALRERLMRGLLELVAAPLGQAFVQRALGAGLALGAAAALVGVFVVQRGLGLVADGLAHATFGGLALGLL